MFKSKPSSEYLRPAFGSALRTVATMAILSAGFGVAGAQTPAATDQAPATVAAQPALNVQAPALDTSSAKPLFSSSYSSSDSSADTTAEASLNPATGVNFANYMQYGGGQRRRYGQPRYRGNNTNEDGSPKYTFFAGVGLVQPLGNTYHYLTPSYGLQVGGGRNFNRTLGLMLQFDYDHFGFTGQTLSNESYIYFGDSNPSDNGLDGSSHVWSFTLNPTFNLFQGKTVGAYAVVGAGFYHKVANFTTPQEEEYCYYYCSIYAVNSTYDHYTSNAPGFNGGFGLTYKFSRFSEERLYAEARYVFIDNSQRTGITYANVSTATPTSTNFYPANSNKTTYLPIKVGLRF
jgi:hypothetical protein